MIFVSFSLFSANRVLMDYVRLAPLAVSNVTKASYCLIVFTKPRRSYRGNCAHHTNTLQGKREIKENTLKRLVVGGGLSFPSRHAYIWRCLVEIGLFVLKDDTHTRTRACVRELKSTHMRARTKANTHTPPPLPLPNHKCTEAKKT